MQKCPREGRKKAMRLNEFTRTCGREDGEEGQGQILRKNLYLELGRRGNGGDIGIKGEQEECITREDKGGRTS